MLSNCMRDLCGGGVESEAIRGDSMVDDGRLWVPLWVEKQLVCPIAGTALLFGSQCNIISLRNYFNNRTHVFIFERVIFPYSPSLPSCFFITDIIYDIA